MSLLINGELRGDRPEGETEDGEFIRKDSQFRNWVTADGQAGPTGTDGFKADADRYHLYISYACPWAHRTMILRTLKNLENIISFSVVHPDMGDKGWEFGDYPASTPDHINDAKYMYQLYTKARPDYSGNVTVPVLWDKQRKTIVNNESSEIIRMFNSAFTEVSTNYYPENLRADIDAINQRVYEDINNGVYKCGFATSQEAYDSAVDRLFSALDELEQLLSQQRYLVGNRQTEADWRLFTTVLRFDAVYYSHFKCNLRRISDYHNLSNYLRDLYQQPGIDDTVNFDHIKRHYFYSHKSLNPTRIVPKGPVQDFYAPHDRARFDDVE